MSRWIGKLACISAALAVMGGIVTAEPAQATTPATGSATFDFTTPDAFGSFPTGDPGASQCSFPVTGTWTLRLDWTVWFYAGTDTPRMEIDRITILEGSFSNPLSGKSVPDLYHSDFQKFTYAPDGSLVGFFENESRNDPYDHMAGHFVYDATGAVVKDVGRDVLPENKHPMDIAPLCDALS